MIEAAKRRFNLGLTGKFAALSLAQPFEDRGQMGRIDLLGLALACSQMDHGLRYFVLGFGRQQPYRLKRPL
jgi:hypothetical protein